MDKIYKKKEKGRKKKWKNIPIYEKIMSKDPMEGGSMCVAVMPGEVSLMVSVSL